MDEKIENDGDEQTGVCCAGIVSVVGAGTSDISMVV